MKAVETQPVVAVHDEGDSTVAEATVDDVHPVEKHEEALQEDIIIVEPIKASEEKPEKPKKSRAKKKAVTKVVSRFEAMTSSDTTKPESQPKRDIETPKGRVYERSEVEVTPRVRSVNSAQADMASPQL